MYSIEIAPVALKSLERLKKGKINIAERIVRAIDNLKINPLLGKRLCGELSGFRSLRVGEYRLIYVIIEKHVLIQIIRIAHRREVYR